MRNTIIGAAVGFALGISGMLFITTPGFLDHKVSPSSEAKEEKGHGHSDGEDEGNPLALTKVQIETAGITLSEAKEGDLVHTTLLPGTIAANPDRIAVVAAKASGVIVNLTKRLGETVAKGDLLATLESRDIADAKGELLAAQRTEALARNTFEREKVLWEKRISSEQDYLTSRTTQEEARIRVDLARQKLAAFGLNAANLNGSSSGLQVLEIRSPISGRIIDRKGAVGASVPSETELFTVADLSAVWIEAAAAPGDLTFIKEGDNVSVDGQLEAAGRVVFVSPVIDRETRLAKVIVEVPNAESSWRPGDFASVTVRSGSERAGILVPKGAIQRIKKDQVVFVRTDEGFEKREVVLGRADGNQVEIRFGVDAGESVAVANSFVLKAQLEKAEAEHSH